MTTPGHDSVFSRLNRRGAAEQTPPVPDHESQVKPPAAVPPQPTATVTQAPADASRPKTKKQTIYPDAPLREAVKRFAGADRDRGRRYSEADIYERLALLGAALVEQRQMECVPLANEIPDVVASLSAQR